MATGWNNRPIQCGKCSSMATPEVMVELYNQADHVVVGCAKCRTCTRRYLFTRLLTAQEANVEQESGQPVRS